MADASTIRVALPSRSYRIHVGSGLLSNPALIAGMLPSPVVALVTNKDLWPVYGEPLRNTLVAHGITVHSVALPPGEGAKSLEGLNQVYDMMLNAFCDRQTTVIALGGGVIGDLAGFAASTYQRGVPIIQVPTSLLAMVDSSVGGKTAINHPLGKNMIGAFHQPASVIADTDTLATLPDREYRSALSEVVKYGLISDPSFFDWIEGGSSNILERSADSLVRLICRSCEIKADFVVRDEFETDPRGIRAHLNLGHTFGHALESALGYGAWLHGEAVSCGMVLAARFAVTRGLLTKDEARRIERALASFGLPVEPPRLDPLEVLSYMRRDKKNSGGNVRLILPKGIGQTVVESVDTEELAEFLRSQFSPVS